MNTAAKPPSFARWSVAFAAASSALAFGCSTGEGTGSVTSDRLVVNQCWDGPFDLQPTFFASDPFSDTQQIRVQRGDRLVAVSDGVLLVVNDVSRIRTEQLGQRISLGLPIGVNPPGFPPRIAVYPPQVTLTLYLYNTCNTQDGAVYSVDGWITFDSLFSGDRNENNSDARLTSAHFEAIVTDPRQGIVSSDSTTGEVTVTYPDPLKSTVVGDFRFFFQRGQPAQPFP